MEFAGLDERRHDRPILSAPIVTGEQAVFSIESNRAHCALHGIEVDLDAAVVQVTDQAIPLVQAVIDGAADRRRLGDALQAVLEPGFQLQGKGRDFT